MKTILNRIKTTQKTQTKRVIFGLLALCLVFNEMENEEMERANFYSPCNIQALQKHHSQKECYSSKEKKLGEYIQTLNSELSEREAFKYSKTILEASEQHKISPFILTQLINTESSFDKNVQHKIKAVIGMGGTYTKYWSERLKKAGIIKANPDLKIPEKSIEATAFTYKTLLDESKGNVRLALVKYKGQSQVGRDRASVVIARAVKMKQELRLS